MRLIEIAEEPACCGGACQGTRLDPACAGHPLADGRLLVCGCDRCGGEELAVPAGPAAA